MINVVIFGDSGYAGKELSRLLSERSDVKIVCSLNGEEIRAMKKLPNKVDVAICCLPPEPTMKIVHQLLKLGIRVIDLSGAHRLKNANLYPQYYDFEHLYPLNLKKAVYGLPVLKESKALIQTAKLVAVPGCYAKAIHLGLLPLLINNPLAKDIKIIVNAVSGYTGAGKAYIEKNGIPKKITAYKGGRQHQHIPEIEQEYGLFNNIELFPHVARWPRGIEAEIQIETGPMEYLIYLYQRFYKNDPYVHVVNKDITIYPVINTNNCNIYLKTDGKSIKIKVVIDNLIQGAIGTALHNMNIMFGLPE